MPGIRDAAILSCLFLAGCLSDDTALRKQATSDAGCGRVEMEYGATTYELPAEDLGRENIGLYTLTSVGNGPEYGRFSLLNCRTGAITRAEQTDGPNDLRPRIDAIRQKGGLASPADLAREAGRSGLHVIQGQVERTETSRAGCACALLHSKAWYSGFPKGYVPPGPPEIMLID